jgi:hypothetical protein
MVYPAAISGQVAVLNWLKDRIKVDVPVTDYIRNNIIESAIMYVCGHLTVVDWLLQNFRHVEIKASPVKAAGYHSSCGSLCAIDVKTRSADNDERRVTSLQTCIHKAKNEFRSIYFVQICQRNDEWLLASAV